MKKNILIFSSVFGGVIACLGLLLGLLLIGDYVSSLHTVEMGPFKVKYKYYADVLDAYDERIIVCGTSGDFSDGSCWQTYNFDLDGFCYNFLFKCNIYGEENLKIEISNVKREMPDTDELALFISMCRDFSEKNFEESLLIEKCEEALQTGNGRILKDYYFEIDEYGVLCFYGCPK